MASRLELHNRLLTYMKNVYFQPPSGLQMTYPCIVYAKTGKSRKFGNDGLYLAQQEYQLTLIENNPDSQLADTIEKDFEYCTINQYFTVDKLNHTTLNLFY